MKEKNKMEHFIRKVKGHWFASLLIFFCAISVSMGMFTSSIDTIWTFIEKRFPHILNTTEPKKKQEESTTMVDISDPNGHQKDDSVLSTKGRALVSEVISSKIFLDSNDPNIENLAKCPHDMAFIPGGIFMAGEVYLLREMNINPFCIDKHEVTQKEFEAVVGANPSKFIGKNHPVDSVTWYEAKEYCQSTGKRLPTEWEWEKAAKSERMTKFFWGSKPDAAFAWYDGKNGHHPVGQKQPNKFGLYDMAGNVWEWTESDYKTNDKVLRGGSWIDSAERMRVAYRHGIDPTGRSSGVGIRCIKWLVTPFSQ